MLTATESCTLQLNPNLEADCQWSPDGWQLTIRRAGSEPALLHWGLCPKRGRTWQAPPSSCRPPGTAAFDRHAVRSPFQNESGGGGHSGGNPGGHSGGGGGAVTIELPASLDAAGIGFVVYLPDSDRWENNDGRDYFIDLHAARRQMRAQRLQAALEADAQQPPAVPPRLVRLSEAEQFGCTVHIDPDSHTARVMLLTDCDGTPHLHWGLADRRGGTWTPPPQDAWPPRTIPFDDRAVRTPFHQANGLWALELHIPIDAERPARWLQAVVFDAEGDRWLKDGSGDIAIPLFEPGEMDLDALAARIIEREVGDHSWTLMHRFHLAHDLLEEAGTDRGALELIFVWLRYSAIRQLDWQRRYNTQPRELAAAQDRLTRRLARLHRDHPEVAPLVRRMLAQVGRGGPGQDVRDGVLHIMHRHRIKELHGTWLEEWHQKLHNNTTPDDIIICQAYIDFLRSGGDVRAYDEALKRGGIDRKRLAGFDRPITAEPEYFADRRDGLIHDFEHFLKLLKVVHAGTDLETSIDVAAGATGRELADRFRAALHPWGEGLEERLKQVHRIGEARRRLLERIAHEGDDGARRDMLYLEISAEAHLRTVSEHLAGDDLQPHHLHALATELLGNLALAEGRPQYAACRDDWPSEAPKDDAPREALLYALAVSERAGRTVREAGDELYQWLQPRAEQLGKAFGVAEWTMPIFAEEVVRGSLAFVLGRLIRSYEPHLYRALDLPGWQVVSNPGPVEGHVTRLDDLRKVQGRTYKRPTIALVKRIGGEEDIPPGIRAIVTHEAPDVLSHVAIRARNGGVMVVGCIDEAMLEPLAERINRKAQLRIGPDGSLLIEDAAASAAGRRASRSGSSKRAKPLEARQVDLEPAVLLPEQFDDRHVGGKALTLARLRGKLPESIRMPASLSLSFGVFDSVLADESNKKVAREYADLAARVDEAPDEVLAKLRELVLKLSAPQKLAQQVTGAAKKQGLELPPWPALWAAITGVWASKWGDRAYWARRHVSLAHDQLHMAVLIQQAVAADMAFVLHTTNPISGDADELMGSAVVGLGEALAGNHPGRPLVFTAAGDGEPVRLDAMPSKGVGLFGGGIVCRSDSSGEDLPQFAGAGLYDSIFVPAPEKRVLRYREHPLITRPDWRNGLLGSIAKLGREVAAALGGPQDIEGAVAGETLYLLQSRPQVGLNS